MYSIYQESLEEYKNLSGNPYQGDIYPAPEFVPKELFNVVKKLKISQAVIKQTEIFYEFEKYRSGSVIIIPDDKVHLIEERKASVEQVKIWDI